MRSRQLGHRRIDVDDANPLDLAAEVAQQLPRHEPVPTAHHAHPAQRPFLEQSGEESQRLVEPVLVAAVELQLAIQQQHQFAFRCLEQKDVLERRLLVHQRFCPGRPQGFELRGLGTLTDRRGIGDPLPVLVDFGHAIPSRLAVEICVGAAWT